MAMFVLSLCPFDISVGVGAFVIGLSQISSFFSSQIGRELYTDNTDMPVLFYFQRPLVHRGPTLYDDTRDFNSYHPHFYRSKSQIPSQPTSEQRLSSRDTSKSPSEAKSPHYDLASIKSSSDNRATVQGHPGSDNTAITSAAVRNFNTQNLRTQTHTPDIVTNTVQRRQHASKWTKQMKKLIDEIYGGHLPYSDDKDDWVDKDKTNGVVTNQDDIKLSDTSRKDQIQNLTTTIANRQNINTDDKTRPIQKDYLPTTKPIPRMTLDDVTSGNEASEQNSLKGAISEDKLSKISPKADIPPATVRINDIKINSGDSNVQNGDIVGSNVNNKDTEPLRPQQQDESSEVIDDDQQSEGKDSVEQLNSQINKNLETVKIAKDTVDKMFSQMSTDLPKAVVKEDSLDKMHQQMEKEAAHDVNRQAKTGSDTSVRRHLTLGVSQDGGDMGSKTDASQSHSNEPNVQMPIPKEESGLPLKESQADVDKLNIAKVNVPELSGNKPVVSGIQEGGNGGSSADSNEAGSDSAERKGKIESVVKLMDKSQTEKHALRHKNRFETRSRQGKFLPESGVKELDGKISTKVVSKLKSTTASFSTQPNPPTTKPTKVTPTTRGKTKVVLSKPYGKSCAENKIHSLRIVYSLFCMVKE